MQKKISETSKKRCFEFVSNKDQRLRLEILAKSMTGEEVARQLMSTLSVTYGIESSCILAAMRDGASVNGVAMDVVKIVYPKIMDVRCFPHTLASVNNSPNCRRIEITYLCPSCCYLRY